MTPFPPHTRGCTPFHRRFKVCDRVSPAHAGMDPTQTPNQVGSRGFPRTRGDRGNRDRLSSRHFLGSPARAGIDRRPATGQSAGAGFPRTRGDRPSGSPYCPDPQQWPHGLVGGHRVQSAQPDRNADRPLEERHRPQTPIPQLLQADYGDPGRPESSEHNHNDRTRTACVRTHRLTLRLGKGKIPSPPRSMQQCWFALQGSHQPGALWARGLPAADDINYRNAGPLHQSVSRLS